MESVNRYGCNNLENLYSSDPSNLQRAIQLWRCTQFIENQVVQSTRLRLSPLNRLYLCPKKDAPTDQNYNHITFSINRGSLWNPISLNISVRFLQNIHHTIKTKLLYDG